jgi:5-methylcytosine-specific restriction enzyme subunit McrC
MERLFEAVLGRRIARLCAHHPGLGLRVVLQGPPRTLADGAFGLRPDVAVTDAAGKVIAILDAKWKHLDPAARSGGVASADAYQLAAYAGRYDCQRLALVYPASPNCPAGQVRSHRLLLPGAPRLDVVALELTDLAAGRGVPAGLGSVLGIGSG